MAHFAKLDENNMVLEVHVVANEALNPENEEGSGIEFLTQWSGGYSNWKQTSYNTRGGVHKLGGVPFRKNTASPGAIYDIERDAFIYPKAYSSWILNEETCLWEPPIPKPLDGKTYVWNEDLIQWQEIDSE